MYIYKTGLLLALYSSSVLATEPLQLEPVKVVADAEPAWQSTTDDDGLSRPAADVGEALRDVNGVDGARMGGRGIDPVIRGQGQTRLNILLDGAYVHNACPNRMDPPTTYASEAGYDRITVIRGVHTLRYGPGGSGGAMLMERDRPEAGAESGLSGRVYGRYQDNGYSRIAGASVEGVNASSYARAFAEYGKAHEYEDGDDNPVLSSWNKRHAGVTAGWNPQAGSQLEIGYEKTEERDVLYAGAAMDAPESDSETLSLRGHHALNDLWQLNAELHRNDVDHLMDNYSLRPLVGMQMYTPSESDTVTGRLELERLNAGNELRIGANYIDNQRMATMYNGMDQEVALLWPDVTIRQVGMYVEGLRPLNDNSNLSGGVRVDRAASRIERADEVPDLGAPWVRSAAQLYNTVYGISGDLDRDDTLTGAFLRYTLVPREDHQLFASASRSQRVADATERYFARNANMGNSQWIGNPDLEPETHHQLDIGWQYATPRQDYQLTLFSDRVSDYIYREQVVIGPLVRDQYQNVSARLYGAEAEYGVRYGNGHETRVQLAWQRGDNLDDDVVLAQLSPINGQLTQSWQRNAWRYEAAVRFADDQSRVNPDAGERPTAGYAVFDVRGSWTQAGLTLSAGVDNLFDHTYADFLNRNRATTDPLATPDLVGEPLTEPGRSVWAGVEYRF